MIYVPDHTSTLSSGHFVDYIAYSVLDMSTGTWSASPGNVSVTVAEVPSIPVVQPSSTAFNVSLMDFSYVIILFHVRFSVSPIQCLNIPFYITHMQKHVSISVLWDVLHLSWQRVGVCGRGAFDIRGSADLDGF